MGTASRKPTYYEVLGVSASAPLGAIRAAYRKLAKQYHPDAQPNRADTLATEHFQLVNEAHSVLIDPERRRRYDLALRMEELRRATRMRPADAATLVYQDAEGNRRRVRVNFDPPVRRPESFREQYGGLLVVGAIALTFWVAIWLFSRTMVEPAAVLDLSYRGLSSWPRSLNEGGAVIERLNLRHNDFDQLPSELGRLGGLILLDASYNRLTEVPPEITSLPQLSGLHLEGNQLREVPAALGMLPRLRVLNLARNQLTHLPEDVLRPRELRIVDLSGNPLPASEVERLRRLRPDVEIRF